MTGSLYLLLPPGSLAALRLFQEAARREEVTAEMVQELAVFFRDARVDPSLRFR